MKDLIISYLFQYRKCPLPGVGALYIKEEGAKVFHGEKKIASPKPFIEFTKDEFSTNDLVRYISTQKNISTDTAAAELEAYCASLNKLQPESESLLEDVGSFYVDQDGKLVFRPIEVPQAFLSTVPAERVVHPNATHEMLVGDKNTTNTVMTEYLTEPITERASRWWIWAAAFLAIAVTILVVYFNDKNHNGIFGNARQVKPAAQTPSWQKAD
ncbi:MAG: hypothetical protein EOO20_27805 [Chryseobacterium sp.]|nr:MAG: hypothetical protein EOO20_27805 [Chryseobacterium sp.]